MVKCTIFKNLFDKVPHYITVDKALERIKNGSSKLTVDEIRNQLDKDRQDVLKKQLPAVCFSGEFYERHDEKIKSHSGFLVLDFDDLDNAPKFKNKLVLDDYIYAAWISPRGNGVKALIRIADVDKHRLHFEAIRDIYPEIDKSGVNESRVCFESYDSEIYINKKSKIFSKIKKQDKVLKSESISDEDVVFDNIVRWLSNKGDAFVTGERNHFIFKLSSACCRFGINEEKCVVLCNQNFAIGHDKFTVIECERTVRSAYKSNKNSFGTASFDKEILVDRVSRGEVDIDMTMYDLEVKTKDVIFGEDVKGEALDIYDNGYQKVDGIGVFMIDTLFKFKEGEITLLSGYGNYGKSSFLSWNLLMRVLIFREKFAFFSPEENSVEFYHNITEMLLGCDCTPKNKDKRPNKDAYEQAYDFISKHIFYVYPKVLSPTPEYIKERFLELIIKEKIKGAVIDPFNQLDNDYRNSNGRSDKYLEVFLSDCARFTRQNNIYLVIVAHPKASKLDSSGNYPCPDVFDIADGAMWNNKMDNILIYDRPNHQKNPDSDLCQFHSKKIRRQKIVGRKGHCTFVFDRSKRRFIFDGFDPIVSVMQKNNISFNGCKVGNQSNMISDLENIITPEQDEDIPF